MSRTMAELERLKEEALLNDQMKHALFWQNEQIMMSLKSVSWNLKQIVEGKVNV